MASHVLSSLCGRRLRPGNSVFRAAKRSASNTLWTIKAHSEIILPRLIIVLAVAPHYSNNSAVTLGTAIYLSLGLGHVDLLDFSRTHQGDVTWTLPCSSMCWLCSLCSLSSAPFSWAHSDSSGHVQGKFAEEFSRHRRAPSPVFCIFSITTKSMQRSAFSASKCAAVNGHFASCDSRTEHFPGRRLTYIKHYRSPRTTVSISSGWTAAR